VRTVGLASVIRTSSILPVARWLKCTHVGCAAYVFFPRL
jgi:hypothetical protein